MSTAAQPFPANVPLVDAAGNISPAWLRFFLSMWTRTGSAGAGGVIIPDTSILAAAMGDVADVAADNPAAVAALMADVPDAPGCDPLLAAGLWADAGDALTPGQLRGTPTNDNAATGNVGELPQITVTAGSAITLTTSGVTYNVASLPLTPGDWDVTGSVTINLSAGGTGVAGGVNTISATQPTGISGGGFQILATLAAGTAIMPAGTIRVSTATNTTAYLVAMANFTSGAATAWGEIRARRIR